MTTAYTSLLGLALPVQGELSGTWGDTVDNGITAYVDTAVAGTQSITGDNNVTLSLTNGNSSGTNLAQVGSGTTGSAQYAILNCTGARTAVRTITVPASSRNYTVINATTGGFAVNVVGVGPTAGVSVANGEKCIITWNGSDYAKVSSSTFTGVLTVPNGGTGLSTLTANYVPYGNGTSAYQSSANFQFDGTVMRVGSNGLLGGTTNPVAGFTGGTNNYIQTYIYNATNGASSSSDFVAYANNSTDAHGWADLGFTSAGYSDTTYTVTGPNEAYLFGSAFNSSYTGNLVYATDSTGSANAHQWYVGGFTQAKSAWKMQLTSTGLQLANALGVAYGGTGATTLTGLVKGNGTSAFTAATAGTDYAAPGTATTYTTTQTFNGSSSTFGTVLLNAAETTTVSATAATGTINYYINSQSVLYYTTNASANWTLNVAFSSGTSLNTALATGQTVTIAFMVTQGATPFYASAFTIDGAAITPKWQGGTAPTSGNASAVDVYSYTITKTGSAAYTVLASQTKFA
jgi:hypothetical protein